MTRAESPTLEVHLDSPDFGGDALVGLLRRVRGGPEAVVSFRFDKTWLQRQHPLVIDPDLGQFEGDQYQSDGRLFGIFSDTAPDRWGRMLLQRRETAHARREQRRVRALDEWDYLAAVSDSSRMGAVRLVEPESRRFLADDPRVIPPIARLRQLEDFARRAEEGRSLNPKEEEDEIAILVAPGSSLGGARPKATFHADDGQLWMAKFPSASDEWDVAAWEFVLHRLAAESGISVPTARLVTLAGKRRTFLAQRFDRTGGSRHLYASAMTLTGRRDHDTDASYLDIAQAITQFGQPTTISADLEELFRRILFNVATGNRDDHLRNHGFLGGPRGWRLAPSFDLNPTPTNRQHAIALDAGDHTPDLELVMSTARDYRLTLARATAILSEIQSAVSRWRAVAQTSEIPGDEIDLMATAFGE